MQLDVTFDQSPSSLPTGFVTAVNYVVAYYDSLFTNNVTINIDVGYGEIAGQKLGSNALGESELYLTSASYSSVKSALQGQGAPGASTLPSSSPLSGSLNLTTAEAQALGLYSGGGLAGYVGFSSSLPFSYSTAATPASNQYYFIGVVEHEFSEVMGRISLLDEQPSAYAPIDLYRYSSPGVRDLKTGGTGSTAYFSINNGTTNLGTWNNQTSNGDLADWYPSGPASGGNDAYNDYSSPGVTNVVSQNDITLMSALGWTTAPLSQGPVVTVISAVTDNQTKDVNAGHLVTITIATSEAVTVNGIPTLQLNDNEVATYVTGSGTGTLTFTYAVQPGDNVVDLQVTGLNLPSGATIQDVAGNNLSGSVTGNLAIQIDTTAPKVTETLAHDTGSSSTDKITSNDALTGAGDPNAVVHFTVDGNPIASTVTANSTGNWTFTPSGLLDGTHTVVASETDAAGNTGTATLTFILDKTAPAPAITGEVLNTNSTVTLTGITAEANDKISVYDGKTLLGTTTTANDGTWTFTTGTASSTKVHIYTATATDLAGNVGQSSNEAILGSSKADTLNGTSGNDFIIGNLGADKITGGAGADTFIYNSVSDSTPKNDDTISDFNASQDIINFTNIAGISASPNFQGQLIGSGNLILGAHSVAYIEVGTNTEVLVNTTGSAETVSSTSVSAANMEIVLAGIHLGLTSADFYHA